MQGKEKADLRFRSAQKSIARFPGHFRRSHGNPASAPGAVVGLMFGRLSSFFG